jgi:O-antigen/teichoic acid export membrane protein
MSGAAGVARNSALLFTAQLVARACGLLTFMVLARSLPVGDVGRFGYALSLVGFLSLSVDFGYDLVVTREVAKGHAGVVRHVFRLKTLAFLVLFPPFLAASWMLAGGLPVIAAVAVLGAAVWHESLNRTAAATRLGRGDARYTLAFEATSSILRLMLVAGVLVLGGTLAWVALAYATSTAVAAATLTLPVWRRERRLESGPPVAPARWLAGEAAGFAIYSLLFQAYFRIDVVGLGVMRPAEEVGEYVAAFRVIETLLAFPAVLTGALYPVLSKLHGARQDGRFSDVCAEGTRWTALVGSALAVASGLAAPLVIRVVAGSGYQRAHEYLTLLLGAYALIAINCIGLLAMNAVGHQRRNVWILAAGAAVKAAWTIAVIPQFGARGACVGMIVTELVVTTCIVIAMRPWFAVRDWVRAWRGAVGAAVGAVITALIATPLGGGWRLAAAGVTFGVVAVVTRAVSPRDLAVARTLIRDRGVPAASAS